MQGSVHFLVYLYDLFLGMLNSFSGVVEVLTEVRSLGDFRFSIMEVMFTTGLAVFVVYQFTKWILDIFP